MRKIMASAELAASLAGLYQALGCAGLMVASAGNVSARLPGGMLISPTGARVESIAPAAMVPMRQDGTWSGALIPSSEWSMHAAIYDAYPAAQIIVHTHSDAATALACLHEDLPPFHYMLAEFGGDDVRCAGYATFGTPELAALAVQALAGRSACLLASHGMICHGPTRDAALTTALRLEVLARQYLLARSAGVPKRLSPEQMADAHRRYRSYGQQAEAM